MATMSEGNIKSLRESVDAFDRGDKAAWLAEFDPAVEMVPARDWPENAPIRGAEAIWDFYMAVNAAWEGGSIELGEVIDAGADRVVANARREARGKASGAGFQFSYWIVTAFREGKAARIEWFADRDEALEAAGLSE
jgi:ketosteroid isomerase-like protein